MTTFEFLTSLRKIEKVFEEVEIDDWIEKVSELQSLTQALSFLLTSPNTDDAWKRTTGVNNTLRSHAAVIAEMRPGKVFVTLARWVDALAEGGSSFDSELRKVITSLTNDVQYLYDSYESFVANRGSEETVQLIESAKRLVKAKRVALGMISLTKSSLIPKPEAMEGNSEVSIFLSADTTYEEMLSKLSALHTIYSELCRLMDISTSERPLHIVRIEAGSLWAVLMGESRIMKLMTSMIESGVSYMHRNFTKEGKVQAIPRNAEAIDALLSLSEKLEANGIDNTVLKENIRQSAVVLGKELNKLLLGEPIVKVDGHTHSIGEEWEKRFLEAPRTLFLESGSESEATAEE